MTSGDLSIDIGTFTAKSDRAGDAMQVVCAGELDLAALPPFERLIKDMHSTAESSKAREVTLDVRDVSFMNSSCFTKLVSWVTRVREMPPEGRYHIRIKANQQVLWQRRSVHALQCFAVDLITIEA